MYIWFLCLFLQVIKGNCTAPIIHGCSTCTSVPKTAYTYDCSRCQLGYVPEFPPSAINIDLSFNRIRSVNRTSFLLYKNLTRINLSSNDITCVENDSFCNKDELQELDISQNKLSTQALKNLTWCDMKKLKTWKIQENKYTAYPDSNSSQFVNLQKLTIDLFDGFTFGDWFNNKIHLESLEFNNRERFQILNNSFNDLRNSPLKSMDFSFHDSLYKHIGINFMRHFRFLKYVKIDMGMTNNIREVFRILYGLRGVSLDHLEITDNYVSFWHLIELQKSDVKYLLNICVKSLYVYNNGLTGFPFEDTMNSKFSKCIENIAFADPLMSIWSFRRLFSIVSYPNLKFIYVSSKNTRPTEKDAPTKSKISKSFPLSNREVDTAPKSVNPVQYSLDGRLNLTLHLPPKLEHIEVLIVLENVANKISNLLAPIIHTEIAASNLKVIKLIDTSTELCNLPYIQVISNIQILNMARCDCRYLNPKVFSSITRVREIHLRNTNFGDGLSAIGANASMMFFGLKELEVLDLSYNRIQLVPDNIFRDQKLSLRHIDLRGNSLAHVPSALKEMGNLLYVDLRDNLIVFFDKRDRYIIDNLKNTIFNLDNNRFDCTCTYVEGLTWMSENILRFNGTKSIRCINNANMTDILTNIRFFRLACVSEAWMNFAIVMNVLLIIALILGSAGYRNKTLVIYFYLRLRQWVFRRRQITNDCGYEYDVFVSYSAVDSEWVIGTLYKYMKDELNLAVCLQDKDFLPGEFHAEEILRCIDVSRRSMIVITNHYLNTEFSAFEIEIARRHVFQKDDRNILMIMKDPVPIHEMPSVLKNIWWRVVCLEYPQFEVENENALFWENLKNSI